MIFDTRPYAQRLGDATSQFVNVLLLNGQPDESISGRSWRLRDRRFWRVIGWCANALFRDPDHCRLAFEQDGARARLRAAL